MAIARRLSQDPSRDVRAFMAFLLVPEEAGQLRHSLTTPVTPPTMFATFSRPPPKGPSVFVKVDMQDVGSGDEDSPMEDQPQSGVFEREAGPLIYHDKGTEEGRQNDIIAADDQFKPPLDLHFS